MIYGLGHAPPQQVGYVRYNFVQQEARKSSSPRLLDHNSSCFWKHLYRMEYIYRTHVKYMAELTFLETCKLIETHVYLCANPPTLACRSKIENSMQDIYSSLMDLYDGMKYVKVTPVPRVKPMVCCDEREWNVEWYVFTSSVARLEHLPASHEDMGRARAHIARALRLLQSTWRRGRKPRA